MSEALRVTASKAGLLAHCQWWATAHAEWANTTSAAADRGTRFHRVIAEYVTTGQLPLTIGEDLALLFDSAKVWVDSYGRDLLRAEVMLAWDPASDVAEYIPGAERDYQAGVGRFCGTADLIAVNRNLRTGYVGDWATGDGTGKGPQLRTLAMMLARAEGLDSVTVEALEVSSSGVTHVCRETLDSFALAAVAGELAENIGAIPGAEPEPGPHCGDLYCPARATCPAVVATIVQVIPPDALVKHKWGVVIANADHAAWLYNQAKAVEAAAKLVKDAVKAYVPAEGLQLADGSVLAEGSRNMSRFDKDRAISLARSLGASDEQIEACTRSVVESSGLRVSGAAAKPRKKRAA